MELQINATGGMTALDDLAAQAQMFSCGAAMNLLQLGRVLTEAKPLVKHGEWSEWVRVNAHMPLRTAQQYMQAYHRFGTDQKYAQLGASQIIKLLPMSDDERKKLLEENDVGEMTTRELDEAIKAQRDAARAEARAEARERISEVERERDALKERVNELEQAEPEIEIPKELLDELQQGREDLKEAEQTAQHFAEMARQATNEKAALEKHVKELTYDLHDAEQAMKDQQEALDRAQDELLSLKSAQARGEKARGREGEMTASAFSAAVSEFVGQCARLPYMGAAFAGMTLKEKAAYSELLSTVEGFCAQAREALNCVAVEGGVVNG